MEDDEKKVPPALEEDDAPAGGEEEKTATETVDDEIDFSKVEPEVRKRPIDFINERISRRTERPNVEVKPEEETPEEPNEIGREVQKHMSPILDVIARDRNDREVETVLAQHPEWSKYAPLARKYMQADGWDGVPPQNIFEMLDYKYAEDRGAEATRERIGKSRRAPSGGDSRRPAERPNGGKITAADIAKMSPEQMVELQKRLAMGENIQT